jgi:hypothetical protein
MSEMQRREESLLQRFKDYEAAQTLAQQRERELEGVEEKIRAAEALLTARSDHLKTLQESLARPPVLAGDGGKDSDSEKGSVSISLAGEAVSMAHTESLRRQLEVAHTRQAELERQVCSCFIQRLL